MVNLKRWMAKVSERIFSLRGLRVVADDYFKSNTTGQTHNYTLSDECVYLLICGKINASGSGFYLITANTSNTMIGAIINSSVVTATASGLTLSVKVDVNYMRVTLIKVGGGNKLPYPLNRIAQILRRKEVGAVC